MLIQMLMQQPQAIPTVLKSTPTWVWGLLAGLVALGLSQVRTRTASFARIAITPLAMLALSVWGNVSAFGHSPDFGFVLATWAGILAVTVIAVMQLPVPAGTQFDETSRTFHLPGSWVPMLLIVAIFLVKYVVGVDLAMQPSLALDSHYVLIVAGLYGVFSGIFAGRAARLWRLASRPSMAMA
jgi:drug/metabolite transporter superfamily protein YnfA